MLNRIKRLKIEGFRGATQPLDLEIDAGKPLVLIFGENGTGKSTIVDAIEAVGAGSTTFLNDWKLGKGKRKESFIPTLGQKLSDVRINLEFGDNTYSATLNARGLQLCATPDSPITKVLRRRSLQAFMDADPAQRYKEVAAFLDIPQIEASETSLREALKEAQKQFELTTSAYDQARENLQGLWEAEGTPGLEQKQSAETWGRQQAAAPTEQLQTLVTELKDGVRHTENLQAQAETVKTAGESLDQAQQEWRLAKQQLVEIESKAGQGNAELVALLQDARTYLTKTPDTLCPVCEETTIVPAKLVKRLQARIDGMNALKQASEHKSQAEKNVHSKQDQLNQAVQKMLTIAEGAQKHFFPETTDDKTIGKLRETDPDKALAEANSLCDQLAVGLQPLQVELENTQKHVNNLTSIKQYVTTLDNKAVEAKSKEVLSQRLKQAVNIVETKRKNYVESILTDIAQEVDNLYQKIHPQEDIGRIKLKLDENQRGSLVYGVAFGGQQDIQPQPYYSESHLDTLGLCIFLALARRGDADKTLVVLDDVLGSVDQQHLQKTITMLLEESANFAQIVITSHYRPLRDQFRYARQPSTPVQLIELKPWDFMQGIKAGKALTYVQDLRHQLKLPDFRRESIAAQAGILFESLLEFISTTYRCRVPHLIEPRYSFGDLESAPNKKLKDTLKIFRLNSDNPEEIPLKSLYDNLKEAIKVRNLVGCHFNQWAGELSDQEVKEMAELAITLADTLICQHCGSLPVSDQSGRYWECRCKKTQMHPLKQPT